ncbi:putative transmembrane protein 1/tmem1b [Schistosoma mansoni]|uniref:putative transmembrane protein 1/tmem1b n=1 Tax=Schistosoma mansoni TaxID=6183 RepID=UPI00022DC0E7|nr:putative transmembrane protein 1/tmem1b [Schistosoma mansoni]|eukprot:XP_018651633.1 putative transmembrane protein 1/tmem1b [Schistosoma mansoni]
MDFILKPVISCAGDENLLPYFESRCLSTLGSQQVVWKHPKLSMVHSVRLGACFTRFRVSQLQSNVKVLSSGRPIRPVGTFQPLLYIYVTSNDVSHYTSHGGRNAIGSWLGHLRARNVFDWLIIMVNSDPQYNTPKILQKSNVLDKIKSDFNVRTGDRQFLEVPAPNSAEEKLFNESWNQLTYLVRKSIISACMSIIVDYDVHLQMLTDSCSTFTWDYFEYLDRKEELAHMYLFLGGHEHALHEYREATELLSKCIQASTQQGSKRPQWLDRLTQLSSSNEVSHYVCDYSLDVTNTEIKQSSRLKNRNATLFELKNYLLSRQASILCICDRLNEFPALAYHTICSTLTEINILNVIINDSLINQQSTRDSIQQQQQYDLVDQLEIETDQTKADQIQLDHSILFAHNHLIPLFTSSIIYSQIFTAIGQTLIGFLKLIHCPKRAYEIVYDLADFLFSQGAHESASWLYESLINHYDESSWIGLVTSTRICLAWCFHSLCVKKHFETKEDYEIARKYIQICFILAGTKCSILRIAAIHVYNKIQFWYQTINFTEILSIPTFNDSINPNYWWEEAVEFRNSLLSYHQYVILDPYQMSPLFRLKSIELEGVCNCGYQLIFIQLKSNSDRTFKASVHISGSEPSYIDWQTLLNPNEFLPYHVMDKTNQLSMPQLDSQLHLINLTTAPSISVVKSLAGSNVHNPITIGSSNNNNRNSNNNSSGSHKVISRGQYSISSEKNSIQYNKYHLPTTEMTASIRRSYSSIPDSSKEYLNRNLALKGNQLRISKMNSQSRLGSLLNVAASLASRPAWKSQDTIGVMSDEHNNTPMSTPHIIRNGRMIRIPSDGLIEPNIHSSVQISRQHSLCSTKKRSRLSFSINGKHDMFGNENTESSTPVSTKNPLFILNHEESFVMIKPGLNKLSFIANVPGFLIPEQIFINCLDEINTEFKEASREQQSMEPSNNSRSEVNFVSDIDSDVFGSSWRDTAMMKALLPKPEISVLNNSGDKRYPVVFGTCQPIPVRLRLGKLGLPEDCKLSTSLYRICSNNKNFVFNTKPENTHINVKKTNSMKTYNNTNGNDGNETMFNNQTSITVDSSYEIRNQYSANDYSLISNSLDNHHQDEHLHKKHQTLFSQFILEDGPVDFIREYNSLSQSLECKMNHPIPTFPPGCCLQLSRPLYLSATSCNDQFALSMPSGHYCILPVDIIKPLGFNLNIFPLPKTYVIFSLNITCVDSDPDSTITPEVYYSQNLLCKYPVTFELSNMRFYICASKLYLSRRLALSSSFSNGQHQLYNRQLKSRSHVSMEDNRQIAGDFTKNDVHETGSTDKLHDTINESIESLTGDLLDNRITKAYVTHLTPFSIPWRFKSLEYNNFMKLCKESHCQPIGRFECTMNRIGNVKKINQDIRVDCVIGQQI